MARETQGQTVPYMRAVTPISKQDFVKMSSNSQDIIYSCMIQNDKKIKNIIILTSLLSCIYFFDRKELVLELCLLMLRSSLITLTIAFQ